MNSLARFQRRVHDQDMDATIKQLEASAQRIAHLKAPRGATLATVEAILKSVR